MARLFEFSIMGVALLALLLGMTLAIQVSPWLGLLVFLILGFGLVFLFTISTLF